MKDDKALWRGIAEETKRRQAIRAAHHTVRGEWYAVLEVARAHGTSPFLWEQITVTHAKCKARDEAVEAGRWLIAKADWVGPDVEIIVNARCAIGVGVAAGR